MAVKFDPKFNDFVTNEHDLVGRLAYTIYMYEKEEYIKKNPDAENLDSFESACTNSRIKNTKDSAEALLKLFMKENVDKIADDLYKKHYETLEKIIQKNKETAWTKIKDNFFATAVTGIIFLIGYGTVKVFGSDIADIFRSIWPDKKE